MFAARGLPQLDVKDIFTVTTSHTQVLDLPREIIFGQPGDRTAGMSARVTAGRKRGDHLRAVT
jgi:hypothetical protein